MRRPSPLTTAAAGLVAAGALTAILTGGPEPTTLRVGVPLDAPGLSLRATGETVGLATAVARYVAADLGYQGRGEITWVGSPGRSRSADVAGRGVDIALGPDPIPPGRAGQVVAVGPYLVDGLRLAVRDRGPVVDAAGLAGRRACVPIGSGAHRRAAQVLPGASVVVAQTVSTCLADVAARRADAALDDGIVLAGHLVSPAHATLRLVPGTLTRDEHVVLVARDRPELCRAVTRSVRAMVASGAWDRAVEGDLVTTGILPQRPAHPQVRGCD